MRKALVCVALVWSALGCVAKTSDEGSGAAALSGKDDGKADPGTSDPGKEPPKDPACGKDAPPPGPKPICDGDVVVSEDESCIDVAILEKLGWMRCTERGGALASLTPDGGCAKGQASIAKITCCAPLPPPPPAPKCEGLYFESDTCLDPSEVKLRADKDCAARGEVLADLWPDASCDGGGSKIAKYSCCAPADPGKTPPPPDKEPPPPPPGK